MSGWAVRDSKIADRARAVGEGKDAREMSSHLSPTLNPHHHTLRLRVHGAERHPPGRRGRSLCLDAGAWGVLRAGARGVRDRATSSAPPWARDSLVSTP